MLIILGVMRNLQNLPQRINLVDAVKRLLEINEVSIDGEFPFPYTLLLFPENVDRTRTSKAKTFFQWIVYYSPVRTLFL